VARRRGFFAELAHQQAVAERNRERAQLFAVQERARMLRVVEQTRRANERAQAQLQRAYAVADRAAQQEATRAHVAQRQAEVDLLNAELAMQIEELDNLLAATLEVDDYVDLENLRVNVEHPPFHPQNGQPVPPPMLPQPPPEPVYTPPPAPTGLSALLSKKKHERAVAAARAAREDAMTRWHQQAAAIPAEQLRLMIAPTGGARALSSFSGGDDSIRS
jgi:restriction system protein